MAQVLTMSCAVGPQASADPAKVSHSASIANSKGKGLINMSAWRGLRRTALPSGLSSGDLPGLSPTGLILPHFFAPVVAIRGQPAEGLIENVLLSLDASARPHVSFDKVLSLQYRVSESKEVIMRALLFCLAGVALVLSNCNRSGRVQSNAAIQQAIEQHLQKQSSVLFSNMTVEVQDVKFAGDRANAEVKFRSKQSPDLVVGRHYILRRVEGQWEVESSSSPGGMGNPHGGTMSPAPGSSPAAPVTPQPSH